MTINQPIVIIGAGIAGVNAAEALRNGGHTGRIILFDRDSQTPYDRPPLSKEFILGELSEEEIHLRSHESLQDADVELKLGVEVDSIDTENRSLVSSEGEEIKWGKLLLATGSRLRELKVEGSNLEGIHYLKTLSDANAIRQKLDEIEHITIVGAGFIGAELASSFKKLGKTVTLVERASLPLAHILGDDMGEYFMQLHQANGVDLIIEDSVVQFEGTEQVEKVITEKGRTIPSQAVIVGIGVIPNIPISHDGLEYDRGYIVNEYGETSLPGVYAAGDCSVWPYRGNNVHLEHWDHAVNHGKCVAQNMLNHQSTPYTTVPYFWSDQYNHRLQYVGNSKNWHSTVLRGDMKEEQFTFFYLNEDDEVEAALIVNQPKNALAVRRLVKSQQKVDTELLSDPEVSLKKVNLQSQYTH